MAGGLGRLLTSRQVWRFQLACRVPAARLNHVDAVQIAATSSAGPCPACRGFFMRRAQLLPASTSGHSGRSREHRKPLPKPETAKTPSPGSILPGSFYGGTQGRILPGLWGYARAMGLESPPAQPIPPCAPAAINRRQAWEQGSQPPQITSLQPLHPVLPLRSVFSLPLSTLTQLLHEA